MEIIVEHNPASSKLDSLGVSRWPTWSKELSKFSWAYSEQEIAYILEGEVTVTPKNGSPVSFGKGDLVTFPMGLECIWEVKSPLLKHYHFG